MRAACVHASEREVIRKGGDTVSEVSLECVSGRGREKGEMR